MKLQRLGIAAILLSALYARSSGSAEHTDMLQGVSNKSVSLPLEGRMPSLGAATTWLNSEPLTAAELRGRVVLVQFWTYTCINWLRTFPYVHAWAEKYKTQGLVVIGVHTPEFSFEKDIGNIRRAAQDLNVHFPIAVDTDFALWNAFDNHYWPALYFVDSQGRIRHHVFGEGEYEKSERTIQQLLAEAGHPVDGGLVPAGGRGATAGADWVNLRSPETYVGTARGDNFVSSGAGLFRKPLGFAIPTELQLNHWALAGDWRRGTESATLNEPGGRIAYRFHARDLHLVMGPGSTGTPVRFRVLVDGKPPGASHGADADQDGLGTLNESRMYQLIRQRGPIFDRLFEIEFLDEGAEVFVFTFG